VPEALKGLTIKDGGGRVAVTTNTIIFQMYIEEGENFSLKMTTVTSSMVNAETWRLDWPAQDQQLQHSDRGSHDVPIKDTGRLAEAKIASPVGNVGTIPSAEVNDHATLERSDMAS